ncbi:MAG TPA: hypothetical protein VK619_01950, partial [Pyrinomonadaceae bacterium]|nr:hypothetical protein [Pyrinomonadaceae bacterium]
MSDSEPIVKQLDHIIARTDDPQGLFSLFTETFGLPVSWPLASYPVFASGGVTLGNINLEILSVAQKNSGAQDGARARFCAIAFEAASIEEKEKELRRRGISHSPVLPYVQVDERGVEIKLWSNVMLGGMLGKNFWVDALVSLSRMPGATSNSNAGKTNPMVRWSTDKMFGSSLVFMVEYFYENYVDRPHWSEFRNHDEKRAFDLSQLRERQGGALGVLSVKEVVAGVKAYDVAGENWRKCFAPVEPRENGVWEIADGPAVRLVPATENLIKT